MKEVDNEDGFAYWLKKARVGEKVVYFDGFLMLERQKFIMAGGSPDGFPQKIKAGIAAWKAYRDGLVALVQRKKDEGSYEYIAAKL